MVSKKWNKRPSEMIGLDEDEFTKYCFDEAVAYFSNLQEKKAVDEARANEGSDSSVRGDKKHQNALDFLTQDQFKMDGY